PRGDVFKLDSVIDGISEVDRSVEERLPEIAGRTAEALATHINGLPPRTMVVVFGDHGFRLDPKRRGTTEEVRIGGASPEEVLVPAFCWLTGAVH
ncbi:MAG: hypothetical protein MK135_16510, partial [Polyangiaceae bacterium]|nr:hypothetical protein [Polyangiaceae bacterium]